MNVMEISERIPSIAYARLFYQYGRLEEFLALGFDEPSDDRYMIFIEALSLVADAIWSDYLEDWCVDAWYFSNRSMTEYYRLCRVYGSAHSLKLKDNPYMREAQQFVEDVMDFEYSGGYGWWLNTKISREWASGLILRTDECFCGEFELIKALLEIQAWYPRAVYRLRGMLLEEGIIHLPALPAPREVDVG